MACSWKKAGLVALGSVAGGAALVLTGGLAAPAIGTAIGGMMGFSGTVATSAGLAAIGGGSLAAGGLGMAGGSAIVMATAGTVGAVGTGVVMKGLADGIEARRCRVGHLVEREDRFCSVCGEVLA